MDKKAASSLIRDTFQQPFDKERFVHFVKNLVNNVDETKALVCQGQYIHEKFRDFVKKYERIGTYTDPSDQKVDILIVYLKNEGTLARARTSQRNFISTYLKSRDAKDAGLIAFVSPNPEDWRFSFVKMEYKLAEKKGKVRAEEEFTPARRYSFLVGRHESNHTAQQQLLPILSDDQHNPTLEIIENAFKIEIVTEEFFEKYRDLFIEIKEALDALIENNPALKKEFIIKNVDSADFSKKLLGQIVFLHFLQKKGWFGVDRDAPWGSGHKDFLRQLFEGKLMKYKNFFNDVLEPLFYEALASDRSDNDHFYSKFNCKIPFLNGGLFDSINGYDWVHTDINLPNELFSNDAPTKEGDTGTGVLDVFDRYNFTVKEDEPLEKEVAIDPEMLGKVFEKLLPVNERNIKATFYTPREIVHYMCQECLINYLATELEGIASKEDIQLFIRMGETVIEHDARVIQRGEENSAYSFKLPESIRKNAGVIDLKLATIRVCDPAIGSGAFPVGMMNEIVRARQTLSSYLPKSKERLPYDLKRHAIQESLYGVDIDPGAVEIAKLRLWLSLIVDEDDIERIKPLPNLDYRIMQGNSLLEEFEGIRLFDDKLLESNVEDRGKQLAEAKKKIDELQRAYIDQHTSGKLTDTRGKEIHAEIKKQQNLQKQLLEKPVISENMGMFDAPSRAGEVLKELKSLHSAFFSATQRKKKDEIKKEIEALDWELIEISLTEKKKGELLEKLKRTRVRPFFLWKLHFADVFREKGGFDVMIANPPYLRQEEIKDIKPQLEKAYQVYTGTADIHCYFYELGFNLLHTKGTLGYITSNKYLRANYGKPLRQFFKRNAAIVSLVDFGDLPVFDATAYPCILIASKADGSKNNFLGCKIETNEELYVFQHVLEDKSISMVQNDLPENDGWNIEKSEVQMLKIKLDGNPDNTKPLIDYVEGKIFYGIKSGLTEAFVIDEKTKNELLSSDPKSIDVIKPLLRGRDIKRYQIVASNLYLIFTRQGIDIHQYPAIEKYLSQFKLDLEPRTSAKDKRGRKAGSYKWFEIQDNVAYWQEFEKPKIISARFMTEPLFGYDKTGAYTNDACYIISTDDMYLYGIINSKISWFFLYQKCCSVQNDYTQVHIQFLQQVPIRIPDAKQRASIAEKATQIIEQKSHGKKTDLLETQIDRLVYEIYGLTDEEIGILEESIAR